MATYTDAAQVERLLKHAIGYGSKPDLSVQQISDMVALAGTDGTYTSEGMQLAAVTAWGWKSGLTADQYDLKAASGASLTRNQWWTHCMAMAGSYRSGALSVDGLTLGDDLSQAGIGEVLTVEDALYTGRSLYATGSEWG